jgi:hypothetical protein
LKHLVVAISAHGYGHISQTGPVLDALHAIAADIRVTVVYGAPELKLRGKRPPTLLCRREPSNRPTTVSSRRLTDCYATTTPAEFTRKISSL